MLLVLLCRQANRIRRPWLQPWRPHTRGVPKGTPARPRQPSVGHRLTTSSKGCIHQNHQEIPVQWTVTGISSTGEMLEERCIKHTHNANHFFMLEFETRVVAAALQILGKSSLDDIPRLHKVRKQAQEGSQTHTVSKAILDTFICSDSKAFDIISSVLDEEEIEQINAMQMMSPNGRFMCRSPECPVTFKHDGKRRWQHEQQHNPPPVIADIILSDSNSERSVPEPSKRDDVYNYNCCLLSYSLLFTEFLDAVAEGDGDRNLRCWKMFLPPFKNDSGSTKYAAEALYYSLQVNSLWSPRQAYRLKWNRSVNLGKGSNVPLDLDLEHDNKALKEEVKELHGNVTVKAINRLYKTQFVKRGMLGN